jgi:menaquinone-dependent protoporphyrinogen oxidase
MRVLVLYASRTGCTAAIAQSLAASLRAHGLRVRCEPIGEEILDLERFDAFVVGSAVSRGHWLEPATRFVMQHIDLLTHRPTWLFSSGLRRPTEDDAGVGPGRGAGPAELPALRALIGPRDHAVFTGTPEASALRLPERARRMLPRTRVARATAGPPDPERTAGWAASIADQLLDPAANEVTT